jgi:hypothetical protein
MGIEPTYPAWKAGTLPLSYTRFALGPGSWVTNPWGAFGRRGPNGVLVVFVGAFLSLTGLGGAGFEPAKAVPPDLQSGPFGRLGIHPSKGSIRAPVPH